MQYVTPNSGGTVIMGAVLPVLLIATLPLPDPPEVVTPLIVTGVVIVLAHILAPPGPFEDAAM